MLLSDFNSIINLPRFVEECLGEKGYSFVKLPIYGWLAYKKEGGFLQVRDAFEFGYDNRANVLYEFIVKKQPHLLDSPITYSEQAAKSLQSSVLERFVWKSVWKLALEHTRTGNIQHRGRWTPVIEALKQMDVYEPDNCLIGVQTPKIVDIGREIRASKGWPSGPGERRFLIPTFYAPNHLSSIDLVASLDDVNERSSNVYMLHKRGWYGYLDKKIVASPVDSIFFGGNTWSPLCKPWTSTAVELADNLTLSSLLRIWSEGDGVNFSDNILDRVANSPEIGNLPNYIAGLTKEQMMTLQDKTGARLMDAWKKAKEQKVQINNVTFINRYNEYWVLYKGKEERFTNFTISINTVKVHGTKADYHCTVNHEESSLPVIIEDCPLSTGVKLTARIQAKVFELGLCIPDICTKYKRYLGDVIIRLNSLAKVEKVDEAKKLEPEAPEKTDAS